ncbi:hypothetical protein [Salicibibacter kimchii]|uniref:hypothetical protein n=1 Tax=Salicibibacter kimchii TaxID=2099786 RepID=UPI001358FF5F|nr:hypothetical protein [Salicibibacter kimchii]
MNRGAGRNEDFHGKAFPIRPIVAPPIHTLADTEKARVSKRIRVTDHPFKGWLEFAL